MQVSDSLLLMLINLYLTLTLRRRLQLLALLSLMLLGSVSEVFTLASAIPFLTLLANPEKAWQNIYVYRLGLALGIENPSSLVVPTTAVFIISVLIAAIIRLANVWLNSKFSSAIGSDLSCEAYRRTLYQDYENFIAINSSVVIASLQSQVQNLVLVINNLLTFATTSLVLIGMLTGLMIINLKVTLLATLVFGSAYGIVIWRSKSQVAINSKNLARYTDACLKSLQEGLGAFRDVTLDSSQEYQISQYKSYDRPLRNTQASTTFLGFYPRYVVEAFGLCVLAMVAYAFSNSEKGLEPALPLLGAIAISSQKILPALQQTYTSWTIINAYKSSLESVLRQLNNPMPGWSRSQLRAPYELRQKIIFKDVSFSYSSRPSLLILKNLNFEINRGERIGIIGMTGSGKSTLIDLIMGFLKPTKGIIFIDGCDLHSTVQHSFIQSWRTSIAHVPQSIYLVDRSIAENIALNTGQQRIDHDRLVLASTKAQIHSFITSLPEGYDTVVGERGISLSGGQRQRIGIARALYKKSQIIIFDEATSALDAETEKSLMLSIEQLGNSVTIIIIAHRLSTLSGCDKIIRLSGGVISQVGTPAETLHAKNNQKI